MGTSATAKTVLLTGATGFVGRQIHRRLIEAGHEVFVTVRPGHQDRLKLQAHKIIEIEDVFSLSAEKWHQHLEGVDAVIHSAWYVEPGIYLDSHKNIDCLAGTLSLAEGAQLAGVGHFIGIGTCMEYQLPSDQLHVDAPLAATTLYAASKLALYKMLSARFRKIPQSRFSWCRLFYLYGEGEHPKRLVPYIRRQIESGEIAKLSAGTQLRDFMDVRDAGRQIADVVLTGQPDAINICSGTPITIRNFAEKIADHYGRRDLLEFGTASIHPSDPTAVVGISNLWPLSTETHK